MRKSVVFFVLVSFLVFSSEFAFGHVDDEEGDVSSDAAGDDIPIESDENIAVEPQEFVTPDPPSTAYFVDSFKDRSGIGKKWILSEAKKDDVDDTIAKYNGQWDIDLPEPVVLKNDFGLILKTKARHHAISAKLQRPFTFDANKPLIMQYDVKFQNGQDCGGAYVKLLTAADKPDLKQFQDKTPYSIMFGPDKCGLQSKLHFIVKFENPKNGIIGEHQATQTDKSLEGYFTDKKSHLYTLALNPDSSYKIYVDQKEVSSGNLLTNIQPPIVPPKEIDDPNDKKPEDWDEREKVPDENAKKPEDWDETLPEYVDDADAKLPDGWLQEEPEYIPDETATRPDDWDDEMDGKWEAPLIKNPKCEGAPGCGKWVVPKKKNPLYKGKWKAPMIANPNFKGKWKPGKIENPAYFETTSPFENLQSIGAVGLELWTMSDGIIFDNFLITDDKVTADNYALATWYVKQTAENKVSGKSSIFGGLIQAANDRPWLWAIYLLVILIPIVLVTIFCFSGGQKDEVAARKKTDKPQADVVDDDDGSELGTAVSAKASEVESKSPSKEKSQSSASSPSKADLEDDDDEEEDEDDVEVAEEKSSGDKSPTNSPRRRVRKD